MSYKKLSKIGVLLGTAFQIKDDIIGFEADLREGKKTLLISYALKNATQNQKKKIRSLLGAKNISKRDLLMIRKIIKETGSLDYSKKLVYSYISNAKNMLQRFKGRKEGEDSLNEIINSFHP